MTLRVTLEIVPFGDEDKKYEIGKLDIFNIGHIQGLSGVFLYGVIDLNPKAAGLYDQQVVHARSEGAWGLVRKVISELLITHKTQATDTARSVGA